MNSWPSRVPSANPNAAPALYTCRSEPQIPAMVTAHDGVGGRLDRGLRDVVHPDVVVAVKGEPAHCAS